MRSEHDHSRVAAAILAAAVLGSMVGCVTTVRQAPDFHARVTRVQDLGLMPPEVHAVRIVFRGDNEPMLERVQPVTQELSGALARYLASDGFNVKPIELDEEAYTRHADLRFETSQVQEAFAMAMSEMYEEPEMLKSRALSYRRSLGPQTNRFADLADVEGLLFARYELYERSAGEFVKEATVGAILGGYTPLQEWSILEVALVEADTGDLLWSNLVPSRDHVQPELFSSKSLIERMVEAAFEPLGR